MVVKMHTVCTTTPDREELRSIVDACSVAMVYSTQEYARVLECCVGGIPHWIIAYDGKIPVGMLPFLLQYSPDHGRVINSLPFHGTHGGCIVCDHAPQEMTRRLLLQGFMKTVRACHDLLSATISISFVEHDHALLYHSVVLPDTTDIRCAQVCTLPCASSLENALAEHTVAECIMARHKAARMVRKALRQNFVIRREESDEAWNALYTWQVEGAQRQGAKAKSQEQLFAFRNILRPEQRALWCAYLNGQCVAALLLTLHKPWVHYAIPAFDRQYSSQQPITALIYHAMCHYAGQDFAQWSFGGTPKESLHRFKASWGAEDVPYAYMTHVTPYGKKVFGGQHEELWKFFNGYYLYKRQS